jgi:hypothetical protein
MSEHGIPRHVIERIVNHSPSGNEAPGYVYEHMRVARAALRRWEKQLRKSDAPVPAEPLVAAVMQRLFKGKLKRRDLAKLRSRCQVLRM